MRPATIPRPIERGSPPRKVALPPAGAGQRSVERTPPRPRLTARAAYCTTISRSFDGPLRPHAFCARTRTKKFPGGASATTTGTALPVEPEKRSARPAAEPASMMYTSGAPPADGADQCIVTTRPFNEKLKFVGVPGRTHVPTVTCDSAEGALAPASLVAMTRQK